MPKRKISIEEVAPLFDEPINDATGPSMDARWSLRAGGPMMPHIANSHRPPRLSVACSHLGGMLDSLEEGLPGERHPALAASQTSEPQQDDDLHCGEHADRECASQPTRMYLGAPASPAHVVCIAPLPLLASEPGRGELATCASIVGGPACTPHSLMRRRPCVCAP